MRKVDYSIVKSYSNTSVFLGLVLSQLSLNFISKVFISSRILVPIQNGLESGTTPNSKTHNQPLPFDAKEDDLSFSFVRFTLHRGCQTVYFISCNF